MTGTDGKPLGNTGSGVEIDGTVDDYAKNNTIGGAVAGAGNVISGNGGDGVMLVLDATRNWIMGNYIGTDLSGLIGLGNAGHGVELLGASNNTIGGTVLGAGNTIAFNGKDGVLVDRRVSSGNAIQRNAIFSHSFGLGIELANGANNDQPIPILTSVSSGGGTVTIQGVVQGFAPNTSYTLELFADTKCNPSGFGEGERYLGSVTVMTDDSGNATFTAMFSVAVPDGQFVSATATDPNGNTSQFAPCLQVPSPTPPPPGNAPRWLLEPAAVAAVLASFLDPRAASADAANCLTESVLTRQNSVPPQPEVDLYFAGLNADQLGDSHDRSSCSPPPSSWASCGF